MTKLQQDGGRSSAAHLNLAGNMQARSGRGKFRSRRFPQRSRLLWLVCVLAAMAAPSAPAQTTYSEIVLHSFAPAPPKGTSPYAGVIRDEAGNLYGTAAGGGAWNQGVVYKVDTAGHATVLYSFTGGADGSLPGAGVIRDSAGNLYGTTRYGGAAGGGAGWGVVYKLDTAGQETVLYTFKGQADGSDPYYSGVIRDSTGNLYGTTQAGGAWGAGVVYKVDTSGQETVLYSFRGNADGGIPQEGVVRDSAGNFYGTTYFGGAAGSGVVFKLDSAGHETVLYSFTGGADGRSPTSGVVRDSAGNLYGTALGGTAGYGVVYKLDTADRETVLYSFAGGVDGSYPGGVVLDSAGDLYGTTYEGGAAGCYSTCGVVFKLDTAGHETVLHTFTGTDGGNPPGGVIHDSAGNLYGITQFGGARAGCGIGCGVVYKLDTTGQMTMLYRFPPGTDGGWPQAGVIRDSAGNLYGTAFQGGARDFGVVYELNRAGRQTVLHHFTGGADGRLPAGGLIRDSEGNLYGTAIGGGTGGAGVVFKLDTAGQYTVLYSFTGGSDGGSPQAGVIRDSEGNLYGTTELGGTAGAGIVYKLDVSGHETVLHDFRGGADGSNPFAGVVGDSAGNLYGTTKFGGAASKTGLQEGVVYKVDPVGHATVLYSFTGLADGGAPIAGVIRDSAGNLYGTTAHGGIGGAGVVYKLDASGQETVLYDFRGEADGRNPYARVIRDSAGNLYGTTKHGGTADAGVVYKLDTSGHETVLYAFPGGTDGGNPYAGVIRDLAGNLYGTTNAGGNQGAGVVFQLKPQ